jgi:phosphate transport system protein
MASGHTVAAFDAELNALHQAIGDMGRQAERQLADAVAALVAQDQALAGAVIAQDADIDRCEQAVETMAIRLLALRQPMARDLRDIIAALKIAGNIERIGDFASNIAKRTVAITQLPPGGVQRSLIYLAEAAGSLVRDVIKAYVDEDLELALAVRKRDAEVDTLYSSLFRELLTYMMESPQLITPCTHLLFIAKNIERIGDHATNIAETICFLIKGSAPGDERTKEDVSSFTVIDPASP